MTAKLATINDRILMGMEQPGAGEKPKIRRLEFACGYLSPYFVTDPERMEVILQNAYVLMHENKISSRKALVPLLEQVAESGNPLLIVAENVEGEALAALVVNKLRSPLQIAAVRTSGLGDQGKRLLQDLLLLTGGQAVGGPEFPLERVRLSHLGRAAKITVAKNKTVVDVASSYDQLLHSGLQRVAQTESRDLRMKPAVEPASRGGRY